VEAATYTERRRAKSEQNDFQADVFERFSKEFEA
jgi:hypothetical protein